MGFPDNSSIRRLTSDFTIKPFDCKDSDLNDFLFNDAKLYLESLLAVTSVLENETETIAFFSLFNDQIKREETDKWNNISRTIPNEKRGSRYPAMKIGRLGVSKNYQGKDIGSDLLTYLKYLFITGNRTGCRFITVDAYAKSVGFYDKNGFKLMTSEDEHDDTRAMYFDLLPVYIKQQRELTASRDGIK
jgi:GNAT superfamily N-acetyltransferase